MSLLDNENGAVWGISSTPGELVPVTVEDDGVLELGKGVEDYDKRAYVKAFERMPIAP